MTPTPSGELRDIIVDAIKRLATRTAADRGDMPSMDDKGVILDVYDLMCKARDIIDSRPTPAAVDEPERDSIARDLHDTYERLAPDYGYSTRPESRKEWSELPDNLRHLMLAVVDSVVITRLATLRAENERLVKGREEFARECMMHPGMGDMTADEIIAAVREREGK